MCTCRGKVHIAVEAADRSPVKEDMNNAGTLPPRGANLKPAAMLLAFPFEGKGGPQRAATAGAAEDQRRKDNAHILKYLCSKNLLAKRENNRGEQGLISGLIRALTGP